MTDLEYFTAIIFIAMTLGVYIYHLVAEYRLRREMKMPDWLMTRFDRTVDMAYYWLLRWEEWLRERL